MLDFKFSLTWQYDEKKGSFRLLHRPFMEGIRNWSPAFAMVAEDVLQPYVKAAFSTEGKSEGTGWKELAPSTVARRGSAHPILHVSGLLEESFEKGGAEHVETIDAKKLRWGSAVPYAMFHEFGTGGRVNFKAAGARKVIRRRAEPRSAGAEGSSALRGLVPRPMLVYSRELANGISSKMLSYSALIARQAGYRITNRPGEEAVSPTYARMVGASMLRNE